MEGLKKWFMTSTPLVKMLMAISITSAVVVVHKTLYAPYAKRQRYRKAEEWANMILEQEEAEDGGTTNISY